MGTTINGIYIPAVGETAWGALINAGLTNLANGRITARSLFLPASQGMRGTAPQNGEVLGVAPSTIIIHQLLDSVTTTVTWMFKMPSNAATGAVVVRPVWAAAANDGTSHAVRWLMDVRAPVTMGTTDVTVAGTQTGWPGDSAIRTANIANLETGQSTASMSAGVYFRLNLQRNGAHAADTFVGTVYLIGVQLDYTSL